jgi:hypothetical protein
MLLKAVSTTSAAAVKHGQAGLRKQEGARGLEDWKSEFVCLGRLRFSTKRKRREKKDGLPIAPSRPDLVRLRPNSV